MINLNNGRLFTKQSKDINVIDYTIDKRNIKLITQ